MMMIFMTVLRVLAFIWWSNACWWFGKDTPHQPTRMRVWRAITYLPLKIYFKAAGRIW